MQKIVKREKKLIPLKELNLTNRFLFDEVMEDPNTHRDVLEIIFGKDVPILDKNETEKELRVSTQIRAVRLDVFSMDNEKTVYGTEMQNAWKTDLAKRSRYYQSILDTSLLEPGVPSYNLLNSSYIIMIMSFDWFGYGKYCYTFRTQCQEAPECILDDGATRIFLNTKGTNDSEVSEELVEFLHYIENTTDEVANQSESERIKRIHNRVCEVRLNEEIGVKYMQAWEEKYYEREEGKEEGEIRKLIKQVCKKIVKNCSVSEISEMLEEDVQKIQKIYDVSVKYAPDYDADEILEELQNQYLDREKNVSGF